ncbi:MAG: response regulator [Deltaproteobacteria bacterium]|nr:response regulator [Deltaproteobacteria bacterium]
MSADPDQMHQVIVNLVTNAFHALNNDKGNISVRLAEAQLDREHPLVNDETGLKPGGYAVLEVEDDGVGMDLKTAQKIFDPYFSTKDKEKGTGLGLAVVHGIVKSHLGHITVESAPGRGARFRIFFPLAEEKQLVDQSAESPPSELVRAQGEKIVFVDDEKAIRDLAEEFFRRSGYEVKLFAGGADAMEFLSNPENPCDLLITDLTMPGMTGEELLKLVKQARPLLPVILCTGFNDRMDSAKAFAAGASAFLNKPFPFPELLVQVKELLVPSR